MLENGPPPSQAAVLYDGEVMHARLNPFGHRFTYRVFSILLDLDRLAEAGRQSVLFKVNAPGIVSFRESGSCSSPTRASSATPSIRSRSSLPMTARTT
jgi:uncharacterized protein